MLNRLELTYVPMSLESSLTIDALVSFHYYQYAPTYAGLVEKHDFWEMVYADSGGIICNADGLKVKLAQGSAIFHPPLEEHSIDALGSSGNACILSFYCDQLDPSMFRGRVIALTKRERDLIGTIYAEGRRLFEPPYNAFVQAQLQKRPDPPFGASQILRNMLENLMLLIVRDMIDLPAPADTHSERRPSVYRRTHYNAEEITRNVIQFLENNLDRRLTMREISRNLSFSEGHLQEIFKRQTGQSIIRYFNGMKIERAKSLIAEGQYTFTQIGGMLGFGSIHYFSRVFKEHVRMSPSEYERSVRMRAML